MIAIALMVLSVVGCSTKQEPITGAILPTSRGRYLPDSIDGRPTGGWKPSKAVIKRAQPVILEYIKDSDSEIYESLGQYRCQYFGIIVNGKKRIYCSFFRLTEDKRDWRTRPIVVDGGGNWYFQLEYDVETARCLNFAVNGES
jgi:hypothetical protein